jgi:hypothetical protein
MSLSARIWGGGGSGSRSPAVTGEAAKTGAAVGAADAPGTTAVSATGSGLVPKTGLGVSTRSGGLRETMRAGGLGKSMRSGQAHGNGLGDLLRLGIAPGTGRGESILQASGRWETTITTPTGNGEGGLMDSFRERAGLKVTGLYDAMSTPHNLENILQEKEELHFTKEVEDVKAARTAGGGEWEHLVARVYGYHHGGVEWRVSGGDVGLICGGNICGETRFCT